MRHGIPLNDLDRMPWLLAMQQAYKIGCKKIKCSFGVFGTKR
jgi:gluconate kinase